MCRQQLWVLRVLGIVVLCDPWSSRMARAFLTSIRRTRPKPAHPGLSMSATTTTTGLPGTSSRGSSSRPLDQHWWPVIALSALERDRPNAMNVLGLPLVAFATTNATKWCVLDDRCSHRFAPLSEGRIEEITVPSGNDNAVMPSSGCNRRLTCSYHGWAFDGQGSCTRIPQEESALHNKAAINTDVKSYPTRTAAGMLWVWTGDSESYDKVGRNERLPLDPFVIQYHAQFGDEAIFMRDLPYGMELLGENLLDLSHLPFAHHSLGGLDRALGGALPMRLLNRTERIAYSKWEMQYNDHQVSPVVPLYQAEILNASQHDPALKARASRLDPAATQNWTCTISYFSPNHVRYRRTTDTSQAHVELFMCPTTQGKSRVFLYNVFDSLLDLPKSSNTTTTATPPTLAWKARLIQKVQKAVFRFVLDPKRVTGHMLAHRIFDGDGIFLHYQGERMDQAGLTFRDYATPSSADILLNAYRRFLERAAAATQDTNVAQAVVGDSGTTDNVPLSRSVLLDRYNTHTKYCPTCLNAFTRTRRMQRRAQAAQTALLGAAGSVTLVSILALLYPPARTFVWWNPGILQRLSATVLATWLATWALSNRLLPVLERKINRFLFEDYVHADKN